MSSTQVGRLETDWAEGAVAGGLRGATMRTGSTSSLWTDPPRWKSRLRTAGPRPSADELEAQIAELQQELAQRQHAM